MNCTRAPVRKMMPVHPSTISVRVMMFNATVLIGLTSLYPTVKMVVMTMYSASRKLQPCEI